MFLLKSFRWINRAYGVGRGGQWPCLMHESIYQLINPIKISFGTNFCLLNSICLMANHAWVLIQTQIPLRLQCHKLINLQLSNRLNLPMSQTHGEEVHCRHPFLFWLPSSPRLLACTFPSWPRPPTVRCWWDDINQYLQSRERNHSPSIQLVGLLWHRLWHRLPPSELQTGDTLRLDKWTQNESLNLSMHFSIRKW